MARLTGAAEVASRHGAVDAAGAGGVKAAVGGHR